MDTRRPGVRRDLDRFAGALYGAADLALGFSTIESLSLHRAIVLAAQGVAIALVTGFSGLYRGLRAKES